MRTVVGDGHEGRRLLIGAVALLALLVIDIVLVALAMGAHVAPRSAVEPAASTAPAEASSPPSASPTPTPASPAVATRLIAAIDGTRAWRATIGTCEEPGAFEITSDGGATWAEAGLQVAGPVFALEPSADGRRGVAVVGDDRCTPVAHRTFTAAVGWEQHPVQQVGSYIAADGQLVLAGTPIPPPCDAAAAVTASGGGVVLCGDGALARNGAGDWVPIAEGVTAVGPADEGVAVAVAGDASCDGFAVGVVVAGALQATCSAAVSDAEVAVSAVSGQVWVWAGDTVEVVRL